VLKKLTDLTQKPDGRKRTRVAPEVASRELKSFSLTVGVNGEDFDFSSHRQAIEKGSVVKSATNAI
jgi:hypothetical protein